MADRRIKTDETPRKSTQDKSTERLSPESQRVLSLARQEINDRLRNLEQQLANFNERATKAARDARLQREKQYLEGKNMALTTYGQPEELALVEKRLALHPVFASLPDVARKAVVQYAHVTGLNPFSHLHAWVDEYKGEKVLHIMESYQGLIHLAGGMERFQFEQRALSEEEMKARGISDEEIKAGALVVETTLYVLDREADCIARGVPYRPIKSHGAFFPVRVMKRRDGSTYKVYDSAPNGRDPMWRAEIRSLRAALNMIADKSLRGLEQGWNEIQSAGVVLNEDGMTIHLPPDDDEMVIEGESSEVEICHECGKVPIDNEAPLPNLCTECAKKLVEEDGS